jgi:hypothetical protein
MQNKYKSMYGVLLILAVLIFALGFVAINLSRQLADRSNASPANPRTNSQVSLLREQVDVGGKGNWSLTQISRATLEDITLLDDEEHLLTFFGSFGSQGVDTIYGGQAKSE